MNRPDELLIAQSAAHALKAQAESGELALLVFGRTVFFAYGSERFPSVFRLIHSVYEKNPRQARSILRHRIYSTGIPGELSFGTVKVAAKSLTAPLTPAETRSLDGFELEELQSVEAEAALGNQSLPADATLNLGGSAKNIENEDQAYMELARSLAATVHRELPRYACDRPIAAVLVSREGEVLSWGLNSNRLNKLHHAEIHLVQRYLREKSAKLPAGARIYVTLKPCRMCAAMIWENSEDPASLQVIYGEFDPGRNSRKTVLDLGTHERKRASRSDRELFAQMQHALE